jgi:hypothetical protein
MLLTFLFVSAMVCALLTVAFPVDRGLQFVALAAACGAAVLAAVRSISEDRYLWFAGFAVIAVLLNPIGSASSTGIPVVVLVGVCLGILASWLIMLRRSIPSQSIAQVLHPEDQP